MRVSGSTRFESATGEASYGRAMSELTITRGLSDNTQLTVTGAAGSSTGSLPRQRWWDLGGPYTVHGQTAGAISGDAFWLGRAELAQGNPVIRPVLFADIGWAGAREQWSRAKRAISGVGAGAAMADGLVRLDVSRGLSPARHWRADLYFEIR
jgi:hemolysin activation/secretion protein